MKTVACCSAQQAGQGRAGQGGVMIARLLLIYYQKAKEQLAQTSHEHLLLRGLNVNKCDNS